MDYKSAGNKSTIFSINIVYYNEVNMLSLILMMQKISFQHKVLIRKNPQKTTT